MMETNEYSLNEVCYEQIKDNFYYGMYGDFKLVIDKNTGCFNATKLCKSYNKRYRNWARSGRARRLFDYLKKCGPLSSHSSYEIREQNNDPLNKQITGQYVHKDLILDIASWISAVFYIKCNRIVEHYFINEYKTKNKLSMENKINEIKQEKDTVIAEKDTVIAEKVDKIDELIRLSKLHEEERIKDREMLLKKINEQTEKLNEQTEKLNEQTEKMDEQTEKLNEQTEKLNEQTEKLNEQTEKLNEQTEKMDEQTEQLSNIQAKLELAIEDRAPKPNNPIYREVFMLFKVSHPIYPFYVIRVQDRRIKKTIRRLRASFSEVDTLLELHCHPNSKTMYIRIKEYLKGKKVMFKHCQISLDKSNITESELVKIMQSINDEKANILPFSKNACKVY